MLETGQETGQTHHQQQGGYGKELGVGGQDATASPSPFPTLLETLGSTHFMEPSKEPPTLQNDPNFEGSEKRYGLDSRRQDLLGKRHTGEGRFKGSGS